VSITSQFTDLVRIPITRFVRQAYTIIPILVGSTSAAKEKEIARLVAPYMTSDTLVVVSSDFCHWGER
jgi:AmmeMemoRadiSam system protein B